MRNPLALLLPALIPSWNFFDVIAPSPRIEYAALASPEAAPEWREFRPRPQHLSVASMLGRLAWNPRWSESLFLVSCAERLMDQPTAHSENEIFARIAAEVDAPWLTYRLLFVHREDDGIVREVAYVAELRRR
jgi:hypothetical protein